MSADNWTLCPRCVKKAHADFQSLLEQVKKSYGKVPAEEYLHLVGESERGVQLPRQTFREDWDLGITTDGTEFVCDYSGGCTTCGFNHSFKHSEPLKP